MGNVHILARALCTVIKFTFTDDKSSNHFTNNHARVYENDVMTKQFVFPELDKLTENFPGFPGSV